MNCDIKLKEYHLCKITSDNWTELRDKFLINWPINMMGYYTVDNFIRWTQKEPNVKNVEFFSLDGDWSDGTFAAIVSDFNIQARTSKRNLLCLHFNFRTDINYLLTL